MGLGGVFNQHQIVARRDIANAVHLAADAGIMDYGNRLCSGCNSRFNFVGVDIDRVIRDVDKHWHASAQHHGVGGADERVGRHDDFIAGADIGED